MNNVVHYAFMDTVINNWLITQGGLDIHDGQVIGLCVESHCNYHASVEFPERLAIGLRVGISDGRACATRSASTARTARNWSSLEKLVSV